MSDNSIDLRKNFFFRPRNGLLNWRKIASVDLEHVVKTVDVNILQDNIEHITFADLTENELKSVHPANVIQLYRLSQLIIEYLLNVQNYFMTSDVEKDGYIIKLNKKVKLLSKTLKASKDKNNKLKQQLANYKKLISAYKQKKS